MMVIHKLFTNREQPVGYFSEVDNDERNFLSRRKRTIRIIREITNQDSRWYNNLINSIEM